MPTVKFTLVHEVEIDESEIADFVRENHSDKLSSEEAHEFMIAMLKTRAEHHKKKDIRKQIIYFDGSVGDQLVWECVDRMIEHQERKDQETCDNLALIGSDEPIRPSTETDTVTPKYKVCLNGDKLYKWIGASCTPLTRAEKKHWNNLNEVEQRLWSC
jgi:hypothetical protein